MEEVEGVRFIWLRTPPYPGNDWRRVRSMVSFMFRVWRIARQVPKLAPEVGKPDVVIGSSPHLLTPLAAYWVARLYRVPFVMEVRDLWPQTFIDMGEFDEHHPLIRALQVLERYLYHKADTIITLLPLADKYIVSRGVSEGKIIWIPNGVDLSRFGHVSDECPSGEEFRVMYFGAHGRANALDVLIQGARIVQDRGFGEIKFVLVGDGPEKPALVELAKKLAVDNVEFRPPVPKDKVVEVLCEADAFVLNLEESEVFKYGISSNKLFDYMAMSRPIVFAVNTPSNPVEDAGCGFTVPPRDPQALADAIIKLYQMPMEERRAMGRRGREYVEKYHAIPVLAEGLNKRLQELLL